MLASVTSKRPSAAVREVLGPDVKLYVDAHCGLDLFHATDLARRIEPHNIGFFEVPLTQNDVRQMAALRGRTTIPLAFGQNEGLAFRFRDLLIQQAADVLQPNVVISGGYSQCVKIAAWLKLLTCRSTMAVPGLSTTCTCMPVFPMAAWSNTTMWPYNR